MEGLGAGQATGLPDFGKVRKGYLSGKGFDSGSGFGSSCSDSSIHGKMVVRYEVFLFGTSGFLVSI